jgi:hypothetical protein
MVIRGLGAMASGPCEMFSYKKISIGNYRRVSAVSLTCVFLRWIGYEGVKWAKT